MRLASIYFKEHSYLFQHSQTMNLGGKFTYEFDFTEYGKLRITKSENKSFIENFWGENISLVTAIVGENGVGKTSLLKEIIMCFDRFREGTTFDNIALIYEINDYEFRVDTKLILDDENLKENFNKVKIEYYNPIIDNDLKDISSYINPSNIFENSLEEFHLTILEYQMLFNYSNVSDELKILYKNDFPKFGSVLLKGKLHYKDDFRKIFALTNLHEGIDKYLYEVFKKYPNFDQSNDQFIHNQNNLIRDVEVTILAIFVVNNVYPMRQGHGSYLYTIQEILEGNDFLTILKKFKEQYLSLNSTIEIFELYKSERIDEFINFLMGDHNDNINSGNLLRILNMFTVFENFYNEIVSLIDKDGFSQLNENLIFSNPTNDKIINDNAVSFIKLYRNLVAELNNLHVKYPSLIDFSFFDPSSNKRHILSNGEKSLLNLYSIIYNFSLNYQIEVHEWENFIFLLDEADLGFHPEWKKRFVNSINKVIPKILEEIEYLKSIQIIFTTHDPLTLSDVPNSNVVYLNKLDGKTNILKNDNGYLKSFGANITDLLAYSFFTKNGLIGDYAKEKIEKTLSWLNEVLMMRDKISELERAQKKMKADNLKKKLNEVIFLECNPMIKNRKNKSFHQHKKLIEIIDEPIIKIKLAEMYDNAVNQCLQKEIISKEIEFLQKKLEGLK